MGGLSFEWGFLLDTLLPFSVNHTVTNLPQNPDQVEVALKLKVPYKAMWMLILAMDLLIFQCFQDFLKCLTWFCSLFSLAYFIFLPNILLVYLITMIFKIPITTKKKKKTCLGANKQTNSRDAHHHQLQGFPEEMRPLN